MRSQGGGRKWSEALFGPALLAASFTVYLKTASPLFRFSDAPELATASWVLGVAHPTGYPLFCLLEKLWSFLLPLGNCAFRAALFSAVCASIAVWLVYELCRRASRLRAPAVFAGAVLAVSPAFWRQATQSTVYSLNVMLTTLLALTGLKLMGAARRLKPGKSGEQEQMPRLLSLVGLFSFLTGLGLGNHVTLGIVPLALALSHPRESLRLIRQRGVTAVIVVFLLLGLAVYIYLPIRASTTPPINWDNPSTWERFWGHISQRDYRFKQVARTWQETVSVTGKFLGSVYHQLGLVGTGLGILGIVGSLLLSPRLAALLLLLVGGNLLVILLYGQGTYLEPAYCLQSYLALAVFAGQGAAFLIGWARRRLSGRPRALGLAAGAVSIGLAALVAVLAAANFHICDYSRNLFAYWHGLNLLKTMPRDSTFFGETDTALFPLYYLKFVEGRRPDVRLYDRRWRVVQYFEQNDPQSNYNREMRIIEEARGPVFYAEYPTVPAINIKLFGILLEAFIQRPLTGSANFRLLYANFIEDPAGDIFIDKWTRETRAKYFLLWGHQAQLQHEAKRARRLFAKARSLGRENAGLLNNLSIYYQQGQMLQEAIDAMKQAVALAPRNPRFLVRLGILYFNAGEFDMAIPILKRSLKIDGQNADATIYLANAYLLSKRLDLAERYLKRTLEIRPHHAEAHNNLGFIYRQEGKYDLAIKHFKEAMKIEPASHLPYFNLAVVYALKGDKENALKWLRRGRRYMSSQFVESIRNLWEFDNIRGDPRFREILSGGN